MIFAVRTVHRKYMEETGNLGEYHHFTQEIWLDEGLTEQQSEEILIHEILEAIKDIYILKYPHIILNLYGVALHTLIRDNPGIFAVNESREAEGNG